ncbi:hypothetical protein RQP46_005326 [Phenoliferia psychrophenolica]
MIYTSHYKDVLIPDRSVYEHVWANPNNIPDDKIAIIDGGSGRSITRGDLRRESQQLAYGLRHSAGIPQGAVVAVFSTNSFYFHLIILALQCSGSLITACNPHYVASELEHQLRDSQAQFILVHPEEMEVALATTSALGWSAARQHKDIILAVKRVDTEYNLHFRSLDDFMGTGLLAPYKVLHPETERCYLAYSSGTSGKAKGVMLSHRAVVAVVNMLAPFDVNKDDVLVAVLPLNHIYGLGKTIHYTIHHGTTVVLMPKFELGSFCRAIEKYRGTVSALVPPIALLLAKSPVVDNYDLSSLRLIVSGAAPLGPELEKSLAARLKCHVAQAYGLSEMSPSTHYCPISMPKSGSIGPLLPNLRVKLRDPDTGEDAPVGGPGEIMFQGPNVMLGYLNRPAETAETFFTDKDGLWLRTGDIGTVDSDGHWFITDRLKELIKYKGSQVAPAELEAVLLECPFVADACVIGVWYEAQATELPRAYVVPSAEGKKERDPAGSIKAWVDSRVAPHKKLRGGVRIVESIPKSPSGKLLRRIIREEAKKELALLQRSAKL